MSPTMTIRPATIEDKDFILSMVPRLVEFGPPAWRDKEKLVAFDRKVLHDELRNLHSEDAIFIAEENKKPLGFIHIRLGSDYYYKEKHGHIEDLVVAVEGEGKGIGKLLIRTAEEWARSQGFRWLTLNVFAQNQKATQVYEKLGYGEDILKYVKEL